MNCLESNSRRPLPSGERVRRAFTLIELLVVIAIIALLAALIFPALTRARGKAQGIFCLNNTHQLGLSWQLYADDNNDRLAYNLGGEALSRGTAPRTPLNWVNNVMSWDTNPDNTNIATITEASLAPYAKNAVNIYRCPSDHVLSTDQINEGWSARIRSYSMNAMIGDAGDLSATGVNENNPGYVQFFGLSKIPEPSQIFVFLDEHPDSINDGYFINKASYLEWIDLPASYHNQGASFSFADGHAETHRWRYSRTCPPSRAGGAKLPMYVNELKRADFDWVVEHMSVDRE